MRNNIDYQENPTAAVSTSPSPPASRTNTRLSFDPVIVSTFRDQIETAAKKFECFVPIYCFMPEHLHLIITGRADSSDTYAAMVAFKQQSGYWFRKNRPSFEWQKDFYDHIIRANEDFIAQVRYIAENPVRRRLVQVWYEYPYTGAIGINLRELLAVNAIDEVGRSVIR